MLRDHNYNVSFAQSGQQALGKAEDIDFDLVLLDIMMPGIDGFEVCTLLKANPKTQHIPVIFLTAKTESESLVKAFDLGGADYVTKPFRSKELLARVETQVKLKKNRDQMETLNKMLQEANDTKNKMFSIISHDLLGPFGNIKESLEIIATDQVEMDRDSLLQFIKAIRNTTDNAYSLLENLLYWARNQQGRMVYVPKLLDLNQLIYETINLLTGMAKNKDISLQANLIMKYEVFADKNAVKTILRNLISNAIKFTLPGGKIIVNVVETGNDFLEISVSDTGIGMDNETAGKIFSRFKNDPKWGTKGEKGVGLGLVISKEFVEKHKGEIRVESREGEGSTFYFTLPKSKF